jgi:hypothetical protein
MSTLKGKNKAPQSSTTSETALESVTKDLNLCMEDEAFTQAIVALVNKGTHKNARDVLFGLLGITDDNIKRAAMSDYHEKFSTIEDACAGLNLTLHERTADAHNKLKVNELVLEHIRFQLEIVDKTVNMSVCIVCE